MSSNDGSLKLVKKGGLPDIGSRFILKIQPTGLLKTNKNLIYFKMNEKTINLSLFVRKSLVNEQAVVIK